MKHIKSILFYIYVTLIYFVGFLIVWIYQKFGSVSLDLIIINIQIIIFNYKTINNELSIIHSIKYWLIFIPIFLSFITIIIDIYLRNYKKINNFILNFLKEKNLILIIKKINLQFRLIFIFLSFFILIFYVLNKFDFSNQIKSSIKINSEDKLKLIYNQPKLEIIKPNNVLVIFLESFDETYLSKKNIDNIFLDKNFYKIYFKEKFNKPFKLTNSPGTEWSMGSMIAVLCGLPLKIKKHGFLNNSKCIQDYLNEYDFKTEFISSTSKNFHYLNSFLQNHKFDKVFTRNYFIDNEFSINPNSFANTISDTDLLRFVYTRIKDKLNKNDNFFIFAQTLDTHSPGNYFDREKCERFIDEEIFISKKLFQKIMFPEFISKKKKDIYYDLTKKVYENKYLDYVDDNLLKINFECLSFNVLRLLKKIEGLKIPNLNIYLIADHRFMWKDNNFKNNQLLNALYSNVDDNKSVFNKRVELSHYDLFPYLLNLSGFKLKSDHAGVGYLFPENIENTLILRDQIIDDFLINGSETYDNLWSK